MAALKFDANLLSGSVPSTRTVKAIRTVSPEREAVQVPLNLIDPYRDPDGQGQPFQMYSEEQMADMVQSVKDMGILTPVLLRPIGSRYQTLAGHNRIEAAKQAGLTVVPAVIKECNDDDAAIAVVDTNLQQRQHLLPSERAKAYKIKMDALGRKQGVRSDLTGEAKQDTAQEVAEQAQESKRNVFRYLALTKLSDDLLRRVDTKCIGVEAGGSLASLSDKEQRTLEEVILTEQVKKVTPAQATELAEHSKAGTLDSRQIRASLNCIKEEKPTTLSIKICVDGHLNPSEYKKLKKLLKERQTEDDFADKLCAWLKKEVIK